MNSANKLIGITAFISTVLVSASMAAGAAQSKVVSKPADITPDGLHRVNSPVLALAWFKPGVDFKRYTKIMLTPDGVTFKGAIRQSNGEFALTDAQKQQFSQMMLEVFTDELGKLKHFTVVSEPGPDVLRVRGAVLEVVSNLPAENGGRGASAPKAMGEATLVVELQDSVTNEFLARGTDRRTASSQAQGPSSAGNAGELRLVARQWASELRERLDEL